jgi:hypothetical protein
MAAAGADVDVALLPHAASRNAHEIRSTIRLATIPPGAIAQKSEFPGGTAAALYAGTAKAEAQLFVSGFTYA